MGKYEAQLEWVKAYFDQVSISQSCHACGSDDWE